MMVDVRLYALVKQLHFLPLSLPLVPGPRVARAHVDASRHTGAAEGEHLEGREVGAEEDVLAACSAWLGTCSL